MAGKAQLKFLMATKPNTQDPNTSSDPKKKGKKLSPALRAAAMRKLQKSGGKKNGNN